MKTPEPMTAEPWVPGHKSLPSLRAAARECRGCPLWRAGTQTVFGEGAASARVMMVGEQPGDREDRAGRPFVGPAGKLLDRALEVAGILRSDVYVTNAVKHFKWEPDEGSSRRLHKKPGVREIAACNPWLEAELEVIRPRVIVALGATAAQALLGKSFRVSKQRGILIPSPRAPFVLATVHPSSILRARDDESRREEMARFVADLRTVAKVIRRAKAEADYDARL